MAEPIKLFAACAYDTLLFGVLIKSVSGKYKISNWRGCPDSKERYLTITGISIAACVHECKTRKICKSVGYRRLLHWCDIFATELSDIVENFGTNQCVFIQRKDIEEDKIACNCSPGKVCKKDGSCPVKECNPYTSNTTDVTVSGNQNHVGAKVKLNCVNDKKGSSAECKESGSWSPESCTESRVTSSTTSITAPSTSRTTPRTTSSTAPRTSSTTSSTTPSTSSTTPSTTPSTPSTTQSTTSSTTSITTPSNTPKTSSTTSTSTPSTSTSTTDGCSNTGNSWIPTNDSSVQIFTEEKNYTEALQCCTPGKLARLNTAKSILSPRPGISCPKPIPHGGEIGVVNDFISTLPGLYNYRKRTLVIF